MSPRLSKLVLLFACLLEGEMVAQDATGDLSALRSEIVQRGLE